MTANYRFTEEQRDCLQEVINVAMGRAGDSIARLLEVFVRLSVPRIEFVQAAAVRSALHDMIGGPMTSAVRQGFHSANGDHGIRGEAIVIYGNDGFVEMAELMAYDEALTPESEIELLLDISNLLNGACLNGIAEQLDEELAYSSPSILGLHVPIDTLLEQDNLTWDEALLVRINYSLERASFNCDLLLLMPGKAIENLKARLDHLLEAL